MFKKREICPPPPKIFTIEIVLGCNLKCPACYIGSGKIIRKKQIMDFEDFKKITKEIFPFAKYVYLHLWGEPLLHPKIFDMIKIVKTFAKVNISTNGQLLTEEMSEKLVRSGVDDIIISMDGLDQKTYEIYRKGGDIQKVINGLKYLAKARNKLGSSINIIVQFIVMRHNEHQIGAMKKFCRNLGIELILKSLYVQDYEMALKFLPVYNSSKIPIRYKIENNALILKAKKIDCDEPWNSFVVLVDGKVVPCCYDINSEVILGNMLQSSFFDIWHGEPYRRFRQLILKGKNIPMCDKYCAMSPPVKKINRIKDYLQRKILKKFYYNA